ncbi:MAG TPA: molybdopterin-binding protein [Gemmatimonadaceae bacterium]|nr:molybdopterin-binding protein [Gemmatimonadaceae bacterium]
MPRDQQSRVSRRKVLAQLFTGAGAALLAGCEAASRTQWFPKILGVGEHLTRGAQHLLTSRRSMAQEFEEADLSPQFRSNGTSNPKSPAYQAHARNGFADWALQVDGLVASPATLTLAQLRAMPSRTQITRHDCVEGWSAIGKWTGVPLSEVLARVKPSDSAHYVVFHCADQMSSGDLYYESIDMEDAYHPQTILAYGLNDAVLPIANGAPLRLRVERQLGYKMAKYVMRIELVGSFAHVGRGKGGYWEDRGYEWFAGI